MNSEAVTVNTKDKAIGIITLNKIAVHNAIDNIVIESLISAVKTLENQSSIRVIVLQANGKFFSAGADLNWMKASAALNFDENLKQAQRLAILMQTLNNCTKPTIAKIQGSAFGGAVGMISCCDIAVAVDHCEFALSEVKLGLIPAVISPYVVAAIGERLARRYFITAEKFSVKQALAAGLIHEIVSEDKLDVSCNLIIHAILQNGPQAVAAAKKLIQQVSSIDINQDIIDMTARLIAEMRASDEAKKGISAFLQKQKPDWNA